MSSCPRPEALLDLAADPTAGDGAAARHLSDCESCRARVSMLRATIGVWRLAQGPRSGGPHCLNEHALAALAEGEVDPDPSWVPHLAECELCRARLAGVVRMLQMPEIRDHLEQASPTRGATTARADRARWPIALIAVGAAATIALLVGRPNQPENGSLPQLREASALEPAPPQLLTPSVDTLRWTAVPRAIAYRLILFDRSGAVVWEMQTRDTSVTLPRDLALVEGTMYLWRVEARVGLEDRWVRSDLGELTIGSRAVRGRAR